MQVYTIIENDFLWLSYDQRLDIFNSSMEILFFVFQLLYH